MKQDCAITSPFATHLTSATKRNEFFQPPRGSAKDNASRFPRRPRPGRHNHELIYSINLFRVESLPTAMSKQSSARVAYGAAIADIKKEGTLRSRCRHRTVQYLNNIIEQDHRAIKRRVKAKQGYREFQAARRTIQGYEAMSIIGKSQVQWLSGNDVRRQNRFINELFEVAA
jgi:hypothetical protein